MKLTSLKSAFLLNKIKQLSFNFRNIGYLVLIIKIGIIIVESHLDSLSKFNILKVDFGIS